MRWRVSIHRDGDALTGTPTRIAFVRPYPIPRSGRRVYASEDLGKLIVVGFGVSAERGWLATWRRVTDQ
jgi:hypothetical protein